MPGARSGGSGGDGSNSGDFGGDAGGAVTVWEVVSLLGKLLGTVAALKVVLYLLRVCLAMAWKSGGASHSELIHNLRKNGIIKTDKVFEVMLATDRCHYAKCNPYMDSPQSIGFQATISAPHMHAYALELLFDQLHEGATALDVGSGSGILTACFARMVGSSGKVIGIDHIKELVDDSINNVRKDDPTLLSSGRVQLWVTEEWDMPPKPPTMLSMWELQPQLCLRQQGLAMLPRMASNLVPFYLSPLPRKCWDYR
ncbi:protein-L-isoaspartate(D-aspartate) O-methyltransferase isoform X5 [Castor canadensis]|uniref:Protein-L-isoaspartate(D-aspartate) O-methyltransferase isoform X5 n=1 Tax=Castor canadensis TaxID=51338 RepID=A0AC58MGF5_CASCN